MDKRADTFGTRPYEFVVERPLEVGARPYGLSVCALNSSLVPLILDNVSRQKVVFDRKNTQI